MSQKNDTLVLLTSLVVTLGLLGGGGFWLFNNWNQGQNPLGETADSVLNDGPGLGATKPSDRLSGGEKVLLPRDTSPEKEAGVQAFAAGDYGQAVTHFTQALAAQKNDPEALIYLNNARLAAADQPTYAIAVSMPIGTDENATKEMLRGVAQAQNEINQAGGIQGVGLRVIIGNDDNNTETAKTLAREYGKRSDILAVVGHFGSDVSLAAAPVYQTQELVMVSPTSTSTNLSSVGNYIFRTVPSDRFAGSALVQYQLQRLNRKKTVIFYNGNSDYSRSLKDVFTTDLFAQGGEVVAEFDFSEPGFNPGEAVMAAKERGGEVIFLAPNSSTLDQALQVMQVNEGELPLVAGDSVYQAKTLQIGRRDGLGMVVAVPWHVLGNPDADFPRRSQQLWGGDVSWRTALAYDATQALITALSQNTAPTRQTIQQALSDGGFQAPGAAGPIRFLPSGDRNQSVQLVTVEEGERSSFGYDFVPVK